MGDAELDRAERAFDGLLRGKQRSTMARSSSSAPGSDARTRVRGFTPVSGAVFHRREHVLHRDVHLNLSGRGCVGGNACRLEPVLCVEVHRRGFESTTTAAQPIVRCCWAARTKTCLRSCCPIFWPWRSLATAMRPSSRTGQVSGPPPLIRARSIELAETVTKPTIAASSTATYVTP